MASTWNDRTMGAGRRPRTRRAGRVSVPFIAAMLAAACAGGPEAVRPSRPERPEAPVTPATFLREVGTMVRTLDFDGALGVLETALDDAVDRKDEAVASAVLQARSWILLRSGDLAGAREALSGAASAYPVLASAARLLEYRLLASEDPEAAVDYAEAALADPATDPGAVAILRVMTGRLDPRDLDMETAGLTAEYATYLEGYRVEPSPAAPIPAGPREGAPVVVIRELESVGADEASLAVAKLSFRDALIACGEFGVFDADSRRAALEEMELSMAAGAAGRDAAAGKVFDADYVASGSLVRTDTGWILALTFSRADDGRIVASDFSPAADQPAMAEASRRFASWLAERSRAGAF